MRRARYVIDSAARSASSRLVVPVSIVVSWLDDRLPKLSLAGWEVCAGGRRAGKHCPCCDQQDEPNFRLHCSLLLTVIREGRRDEAPESGTAVQSIS